MIIRKGDTSFVRDNFRASEFYSKSYDAPDEHYFSDILADAVQFVRNYFSERGYDARISVSSTFRTYLGNQLSGGTSLSQHLGGNAVDWKFVQGHDEKAKIIYDDFSCKGEIYQGLKGLGVKGIGFYKTFFHFDDGLYSGNVRNNFTAWDESQGKFGDLELNTAFFNATSDAESGCAREIISDLKPYRAKKKSWISNLFDFGGEDGFLKNKESLMILASISLLLVGAIFVYYIGRNNLKWKKVKI